MGLIAAAISLLGAGLIVAGVALMYLPAAIVLAGVMATAVGLFGIDDGRTR